MVRTKVVIYSGGMDSFTLLQDVVLNRQAGQRIHALSFDYGQRHGKELRYAAGVAQALGIDHRIIDLRAVQPLLGGSALTSPEVAVPEGHYAEETMKATVVAGRNAIMLTIAAGFAEALARLDEGLAGSLRHGPTAEVYYGAHSGDHAIYPDCRPIFVETMASAIARSSDERVRLQAPYLYGNKLTILQRGAELGLRAYNYGDTWTCYKGEEHACGVCGACVERAEAFEAMGWQDPHAQPPAQGRLAIESSPHG